MKVFWTITYGLRDVGAPVGKHCHRHRTESAARACEQRRGPWYSEHDLVSVDADTGIVRSKPDGVRPARPENHAAVWEAPYPAPDSRRRKRRHRCRHCNAIMQPGQPALWVRHGRGVWVVHLDPCAGIEIDGMTWRERFNAWSAERRAA